MLQKIDEKVAKNTKGQEGYKKVIKRAKKVKRRQ